MAKFCILALIVVFAIVAKQGIEAAECCSAYTDTLGKKHDTQLCADFCCFDITLGSGIGRACCDKEILRVPSDQLTEECLKSWIEEHIWVPIVAAVVVLLIIIAIIACCCCGCCGCCRN